MEQKINEPKNIDLKNVDESQTKFLNDELILVDENDNNIGSISKLNGHLLSNKNKYPHRAMEKIDYLYKKEHKRK